MFFLAPVLEGSSVATIPNGCRGITFPQVLYVAWERSKQHTQQTELLLRCTQSLWYVVRGEGEVSGLDYSAVIVQSDWATCHMDWIASQGQVLEVMMKWHLYSTSCFFSFPQNLSYRTCQREKTVFFSALKRHMGFSVSRRRKLAKTGFSYSPCHSWNLILQCVCKDSTAVPWSINAFR